MNLNIIFNIKECIENIDDKVKYSHFSLSKYHPKTNIIIILN